jgi:hypothetical protein
MPARQQRAHTEEWQRVQQYCLWPEQRRYEHLRPIVLFGDLPDVRAAETGGSERSLRRQADQFDAAGMASLFRPTSRQMQDHHRSLPPPMRQRIVDLQTEYSAFSVREIGADLLCPVWAAPEPSHHQTGALRWTRTLAL